MTLPCTVREAYAFLVDYTNDPLWRDELISVTLMSGTTGEAGALYEITVDWNGLRTNTLVELVHTSLDQVITFRSAEESASIESTYRLSKDGGGCKLDVELKLDCKGGLLLVEPFAWAIITRWADGALPKLPGILDERAPSERDAV